MLRLGRLSAEPGQNSSWRLECHEELGSTSDYCIARAENGEPAGLAALALTQTQGRGSRGRAWADAGDALALSALLRPDAQAIEAMGLWPFVAALAFHSGLLAAIGHDEPKLRIKWPNDILFDGRKLAGILIERGGEPDPWLVIGFGANLRRAPQVEGRVLSCLGECCTPCPEPEVVARHVLESLSFWMALWAKEGFGAIREAWLARSLPLGTPLVMTGGSPYAGGEFAGIGEDGALLLKTDGRVARISTGEALLAGSEVGRAACH